MDLVFITDLHIGGSNSVRTGDVFEDICNKLTYVISYCKTHNAKLLLGGDIFDRPTVPDYMKSKIISIFEPLKGSIYGISGNHDLLYNNTEYSYKTSFNLLEVSGVINNLDKGNVDLGEVVLSSTLPVKDYSKPLVFLYHGFLNQDDGKCTFRFTDIEPTTSHTYVCLGHDHDVYESLQYTQFVKIFRPGSLLRGIRNDSQLRVPNMLHIRVANGKLQQKLVPIKCRDCSEIFKTKEFSISQSQKSSTYEDIINQIRNAQTSEVSFEQALNQVADEETVQFALSLLNKAKEENSNKRQNL